MTRAGWLVLAVTVVAVAAVFVAGDVRDHRGLNTGQRAAATTNKGLVDLKSVLSLQGQAADLDLLATITIQNKSDEPVMYAGTPCYQPASPALESTLRPPAGPPYPAAAAALRARVMDDRRTFDQAGYFEASSSGHVPGMDPCDESAPPMLPAKKTITYSMHEFLGPAAQPYVDAATTDVVTTLRLGSLPPAWTGRFPPPIHVVDTIQVRTPLSALTDITREPAADYTEASKHFDLLMNDARVAAWVDAQDPTLWRAARLRPSYQKTGPTWTLDAFNQAWATPLVAEGTDTALTTVRIPVERWKAPPSSDAVLPPDSSMSARQYVPDRDIYVGDLVLPSGRVMVGDGIATDNEVLFDYGLRPGSYPIHIVTGIPLYRTEGIEWESVAWEELILSNGVVTHWQPAVPVGHSISELKAGELFVFGTDGGGGGFASPEAMKYMDASLTDDSNPLWTALGEREEANGWLWAMTTVDPKTGANVFVTSTGGDGGFPILIGLDAQNRPAVLLSDFGELQMTYSGLKV